MTPYEVELKKTQGRQKTGQVGKSRGQGPIQQEAPGPHTRDQRGQPYVSSEPAYINHQRTMGARAAYGNPGPPQPGHRQARLHQLPTTGKWSKQDRPI